MSWRGAIGVAPSSLDDQNRQRCVKTLGEVWGKTGWRVHAYALTNNHCHLLAETPQGNLAAGMKWLQGMYTQRGSERAPGNGPLQLWRSGLAANAGERRA